MNKNIIINPELNNIIPPLTPDEYNGLEVSIIADGCRDALVLWNDTLVDGHNRYKICTKHNIEFKTVQKEFEDIEYVKIWIINNQKSRRNISDGWKYELAQTRKEIIFKQGIERQKEAGKLYGEKHPQEVLSTIDKSSHNTRNEIAKEIGWSTGKVAMADVIWKEAPTETIVKIKQGDVSINEAYKNIKHEEKAKDSKSSSRDVRDDDLPDEMLISEHESSDARLVHDKPDLVEGSIEEKIKLVVITHLCHCQQLAKA